MRFRIYTPQNTYEWETAAVTFRMGRGDSCELRFEGESAAFASWEHAEFSLEPDGNCYVTDLGSSNGTYVDGALVATAAPLRPGSMVQVGRAGPRLEVLKLPASASGSAARAPQGAASPSRTTSVSPPAAASAPSADPSANWIRKNMAVVIAASAVTLLAGVLLGQGLLGRSDKQLAAEQEVAPKNEADQDSQPPAEQKEKAAAEAPPAVPPPVAPAAPEETGPWKEVKSKGLPGYRLIVVEDPKTQAAWPFAGAVVIGERALLTTATVAVELNKFVEQGWRVAVTPDPHQPQVNVAEIRVHAAFQQEPGADQLYFDLAVLYAADRLAGAVTLASPAELARFETGQPLGCVAIDHQEDPLDRFQELQPEIYAGKLFTVTTLSQDAGAPQLLHLRGEFSKKAGGSPIFDAQGRLVAVYCEPAPAQEGQPANIHVSYAKAIEPQLIQLALTDKNNKFWAPPVTPPAAPPPASP